MAQLNIGLPGDKLWLLLRQCAGAYCFGKGNIMATVKSGLTLMELATHIASFEEGWGAPARVTLELERPRAGGLRWQVKIECDAEVTPEGDRTHFESSSHFPNNSHQTLLGTVLWLAHNVDQQVSATRTLKAR